MLIVPLISGGSMAADVVSEMGQAALQASYTRELETDADRVAVELMNKAGLKAATFTDLLGRIEAEYGGKPDDGEAGAADDQDRKAESGSFSIPDMLATHPSTPDRTDMVHELASPGGEAGLNQSQWEALRSICDTRSNRN
jgi:predicted Zn-dependent protease